MSAVEVAPTELRNAEGYLAPLDGMRAIAVAFVVAAHYKSPITYGRFGVTIFFFLSGFLISRLLFVEANGSGGRVRIGAFYARRILRLFPALLLFVVGFSLVSTYYLGAAPRAGEVAAGLLYFENYYVLWLGHAHPTLPLSWEILWSLAVEEHFYLLFPAFFAAFQGDRQRFYRLVMWGCLAILTWRAVGIFSGVLDTQWTYLATDSRIDSILFGVSLATALEIPAFHGRLRSIIRYGWLILPAALIFLWASLEVGNPQFRAIVAYTFQGFGLWIVFLLVCFDEHRYMDRVRAFLSSGVMSYLGRISYPIYLWHLACYVVAARWLAQRTPGASLGLVAGTALLLTLVVSSGSYQLVERHVLRLRRHFPPAHKAA